MTHADPPRSVPTLAAALRRARAEHGTRPAVHDLTRSITYAELAEQAQAVAAHLRARGPTGRVAGEVAGEVARGDRVAVLMDKGLEAVVAIHGIHAAGAVCVPIDVRAPPLRVARMLADCDVRHVLACRLGLRGRATIDEACPGLRWSSDLLALPAAPSASAPDEPDPDEPAYILYTSGTTGSPKGIVHTHRSALAFASWAAEHYGLRADDRVSSHAPFHFDLSTLDLYATMLAGACVVLLPSTLLGFPYALVSAAQEQALTIWYSVPFALTELLDRGQLEQRPIPSLRWVLFAGEAFPTAKLRRLARALPGARLSNLYGPTETNVCTVYDVDALPDDDAPIPIGVPCSGARALILDADGRVLEGAGPSSSTTEAEPEPGPEGELLIHGPTLMRGYWGAPEATARAFFVHTDGARYYRTGDRVRLRRDGQLLFLGRRDRQIKIRGHRIELDELEHALASHPGVEQSAAYVARHDDGDTLCAAVVPTAQWTNEQAHDRPGALADELRAHLAARLPAYAVPSVIEPCAALPRTSTGKIDRRALARPTAAPGQKDEPR